MWSVKWTPCTLVHWSPLRRTITTWQHTCIVGSFIRSQSSQNLHFHLLLFPAKVGWSVWKNITINDRCKRSRQRTILKTNDEVYLKPTQTYTDIHKKTMLQETNEQRNRQTCSKRRQTNVQYKKQIKQQNSQILTRLVSNCWQLLFPKIKLTKSRKNISLHFTITATDVYHTVRVFKV